MKGRTIGWIVIHLFVILSVALICNPPLNHLLRGSSLMVALLLLSSPSLWSNTNHQWKYWQQGSSTWKKPYPANPSTRGFTTYTRPYLPFKVSMNISTAISTAQQRSSMKVSNQSGPPQHESIQSKWSSTTQIHGSKIKSIEVNLTKLNLVVQQSCL